MASAAEYLDARQPSSSFAKLKEYSNNDDDDKKVNDEDNINKVEEESYVPDRPRYTYDPMGQDVLHYAAVQFGTHPSQGQAGPSSGAFSLRPAYPGSNQGA